jgi:hypothetical protein
MLSPQFASFSLTLELVLELVPDGDRAWIAPGCLAIAPEPLA